MLIEIEHWAAISWLDSPTLTERRISCSRGLYVALFLCAAYLFISAAIIPLPSNSTWYVTLPQAASLPFLFWIFIVFIAYLPAEWDLTIYEYRSSSLALQKATLGAAISLGITAMAVLLFILLNPSDNLIPELLGAGKLIAAGLLAFAMNRIERKLQYIVTPGQNLPPDDSVTI